MKRHTQSQTSIAVSLLHNKLICERELRRPTSLCCFRTLLKFRRFPNLSSLTRFILYVFELINSTLKDVHLQKVTADFSLSTIN